MKVGTDGVLLGAWADCSEAKRILDIGAGTGLIAIMLAQRSEGRIDAVEIEESAYGQAFENAGRSPWKDRIRVHHISFGEYQHAVQPRCYDLIVTNPPYFPNSLKPHSGERSMARHNDSLDMDILLTGAVRLLSDTGNFSLIVPFHNAEKNIETARSKELFCCRKSDVVPVPGKPPKRALLEFRREQAATEENTIIIEDNGRHGYSVAYKELTKDFYLAF